MHIIFSLCLWIRLFLFLPFPFPGSATIFLLVSCCVTDVTEVVGAAVFIVKWGAGWSDIMFVNRQLFMVLLDFVQDTFVWWSNLLSGSQMKAGWCTQSLLASGRFGVKTWFFWLHIFSQCYSVRVRCTQIR